MARIAPIVADVAASGVIPGARATASEFGAGIGGALVRTGAELVGVGEDFARANELVRRKEIQDDVANVRMSMAKARSDWALQYAERKSNADLNDVNFAARFMGDMGAYFDKGRDVAQTKEGQRTYDMLATEMRGQFAEQAYGFQVAQAGAKAKADYTQATNLYGSTLLTDPTQYGQVKAQAISDLNDPSGRYANIPAKDREALAITMRDHLAKSYIQGLIHNGASELARNILMGGKLDAELNPQDKNALISQADAGIRGARVEADRAAAKAKEDRRIEIDQKNQQLNDLFMQRKLTWADVQRAGLPATGEGSQDHWIVRLKQQANDMADRPARTTPGIFNDLRERIALPYGDPRKIQSTDEVWKFYGQGLSEADANRLERRVLEDRSEQGQRYSSAESEFLRNVKPQLDKTTLFVPDAEGGARMQAFTIYVRDKAERLRKEGKDPFNLFRPDSPDYAGKDIPVFQTGAQRQGAQIIRNMNNTIGNEKPPPQRKPLSEIFK